MKIAKVLSSINLEDYNMLQSLKDNLDFNPGTVVKNPKKDVMDLNTRNTMAALIPQNKDFQWIYDKLFDMGHHLNSQSWNFTLNNYMELQWLIYNKGGFYARHLDANSGTENRRISMSVLLSDSSDFKGGALRIFDPAWQDFNKDPLKQFEAIVFPSSMQHSVEMITKGKREVLVCWLGGA